MNRYATASGVVFALVAALQLLRLLMGWPLQVADIAIPLWASGCAFVLAATLALWAYRTAKGAS
jgi:hypothetical protein